VNKKGVLFYSFWRNGLWGFATSGDGRRMLQNVHWALKMKNAAGGWVLKKEKPRESVVFLFSLAI
jgi:hypothetical protein